MGVKWVRLRRINRDYIVSGSKWWSARQTRINSWEYLIKINFNLLTSFDHTKRRDDDVLKGPPRRGRTCGCKQRSVNNN